MRKILASGLIALTLIFSICPNLASAQSQQPALRPSRNFGDVPNKSAALDNLSAQGRVKLTNEFIEAAGVINAVYSTPLYSTLTTYVIATTVPTTFRALKAAVASVFNTPLNIVSLDFYPSDSFSGIAASQASFLAGSTKTSVWPTVNSVYLSCTVNNTTTVTCPSTSTISTSGTVLVFGSCIGVNTGTVTNSTTVTLAYAATCSAGGQNITLQFANPSTRCQGAYDLQGADGANVNSNPVSFSLLIPPTTTNPTNTNVPFTLQWSDYVACNSILPADGSTLPIVFAYMTLGPNTNGYGRGGSVVGNSSYNTVVAPLFNNRYQYVGVAWDGNTDWAATPTSEGFKGFAFSSPFQAIGGISENYGQLVQQIGDSISAAPPDFSGADGGAVRRGCWMISTISRWCEVVNFAWGGQQYALYGQNAQNNIGGRRYGAIISQPISRNESGGATFAAYTNLLASEINLASERGLRIGFLGAFPFTTTLDGNSAGQIATSTMRTLLNNLSATTCQPNTGGLACPKIPVLDPVPIVSRAVVGGNAWDYLSLGQTANGATAAGSTSIPITANGVVACYAGDTLTDNTTSGVILSGATVISATSTSLTVANTAVIGSGIVSGDILQCSAPGYSGPILTFDNTHPWQNAWTASFLLPAATTFMQQLLGYY